MSSNGFFLGMLFGYGLMAVMLIWAYSLYSRHILRRFASLVFYGPYRCEQCNRMICRSSTEQGGKKYDYPDGIFYPNTEWHRHECKGRFFVPQYDDFRGASEEQARRKSLTFPDDKGGDGCIVTAEDFKRAGLKRPPNCSDSSMASPFGDDKC